LALYFVKVGAFTFGGGITVLAFMQDQVVNQFHWLTAQEFLDGLALGQLTPGPVLMLRGVCRLQGRRRVGRRSGRARVFSAGVRCDALDLACARALQACGVAQIGYEWRHRGRARCARGLSSETGAHTRLRMRSRPRLLVLTIAAIMMWRLAPLSLIAGGALAGSPSA
jgi:chromate transporter